MEGTRGLNLDERTARPSRPPRCRPSPSIATLDELESAALWIDPEYRQTLESHHISTFDQMMATTDGHRLRALKDRENWRLDLHHRGHHQRAYLKKHHLNCLSTRLRRLLGAGAGDTAGRVEALNIVRLEQGGVPAMRLIAFGERLHADGRLESFVLTEELTGYVQLDHFLKQRFPDPPGTMELQALKALCAEVAVIARRFHQLGYNHRDFYCCHFFIHEDGPAEFRVNLIDLQRVEHRKRLRHRWIVKDLAQLAYSAPRQQVSCSQKLRFMKHYLGVRKLRAGDKRLIRQVVAKQRIMEWQLGKNP